MRKTSRLNLSINLLKRKLSRRKCSRKNSKKMRSWSKNLSSQSLQRKKAILTHRQSKLFLKKKSKCLNNISKNWTKRLRRSSSLWLNRLARNRKTFSRTKKKLKWLSLMKRRRLTRKWLKKISRLKMKNSKKKSKRGQMLLLLKKKMNFRNRCMMNLQKMRLYLNKS